jgi:ferredoxin-NADP reductase
MAEPAIAQEAPAARPKIKQLEVMVAEVRREGPETATLLLFTGNDTLDYQPGHFLTIRPHQFAPLDRFIAYFEDMKGRSEPARAYSLASAPHEKYLSITVKEERYVSGLTEYPPLLSPLLVWRTPPGTKMVVTGFGGPYVLPDDIESRTDHVVHVCAGSGIVPNMSMLKHALATDMSLRHTLICGNKTRKDIIYRRELEALEREHPERLRVVHALSREPTWRRGGDRYEPGRVGRELIERLVSRPREAEFFVCGPGITRWDRRAAERRAREPEPRFLESVLGALRELEVPAGSIHHESYG